MFISRFLNSKFKEEPTNLQEWRERILSIFLLLLIVFGTLAYVVNVITAIKAAQFGLVIFYTLAFLWVVVNAVSKRLPYRIRAGTMLSLAYALGPVTLLTGGLIGDGRIWLMFFIAYAAILFGLKAGIFASVLSTITYISFGIMVTTGSIIVPALDQTATSVWISTGVVLLWLAITLFISITALIRGLEKSQTSLESSLDIEKELNAQLNQEHEKLISRSDDLVRRLSQIRAAAEISRLITGELDPGNLMRKVVDLLKDRFGLYYAGVFLIDEDNLFAELKTGTGEAGRRMVAERHKLSVGGSSMVGWATANRKARIALDVGQEAIRFNNPHLPRTRSELALPLLRGKEPIGALTIQSTEAEAFDSDDIVVLQGIADSLATAIENANFFQQIEQNLDEIRKLNQLYLQEGWSEVADSEQVLSYAVEGEQSNGGLGTVNSLEVPLMLRDQQVIGNIMLETDKRNWSAEDQEFIEAISNQAAIALESARLIEESTKRVQREQSLNQLTARFSRSLDVDSLMKVVVQELGKLPHVNKVSLHIEPPTPDNQPEFEKA